MLVATLLNLHRGLLLAIRDANHWTNFAGDQTSVWRLVGQLWFSKSFCATRLKASAATVLSQRGAVMPQGQWEQDQPVKSSPSSQIKRLLMHLLPFACVLDLSSAATGGTHRESERGRGTPARRW